MHVWGQVARSFNIADMAIMLGVILLAWKSFRRVETESPAKAV